MRHQSRQPIANASARRTRADKAPEQEHCSRSEVASPRAERRQLTVMFVDLVGSTELSQRLDPEDMREVIRAYQSAVSARSPATKATSPSSWATACSPISVGRRRMRTMPSARCAPGLAAAAATARLTAPGGEPLAARVGIATGLVVVGDLVGEGSAQEEAVVGDTPNLAARLQALAEPGTVVVADGTQRLVAGLFEAVDLGHQRAQGLRKAVARLAHCRRGGARRAVSRRGTASLTPLVGRAAGARPSARALAAARSGRGPGRAAVRRAGHRQVAADRSARRAAERRAACRLRYFCSPYHVNSALHPVITQLERAAGLGRDDSADTKLDKLEALLRRIVPDDDARRFRCWRRCCRSTRPARYPPPKLPPQRKGPARLTALDPAGRGAGGAPARAGARRGRALDRSDDRRMARHADRSAARTCRCCWSSPFGLSSSRAGSQLSHVTALSLGRLGRDQGAAIMDRVAGGKTLPPEVAEPDPGQDRRRAAVRRGADQDGARFRAPRRRRRPLSCCRVRCLPLAIPSTLQDLLMARLDRLAPVKEVAQIGACIGRVFHHRLLAAVTGAGRCPARSSAAAAGRVRARLSARRPAGGDLHVQARAGAGHGLSEPAEEPASADPCQDRLDAGGAVSGNCRGRARDARAPLHGRRPGRAGRRLLAEGRAAGAEAVCQSRGGGPSSARGWNWSASLPDSEDASAAGAFTADRHGRGADGGQGLGRTGGPAGLFEGADARRDAWATRPSSSPRCEARAPTAPSRATCAPPKTLGHQCQSLGLELAQASGDSAFMLEAHHQLWGDQLLSRRLRRQRAPREPGHGHLRLRTASSPCLGLCRA